MPRPPFLVTHVLLDVDGTLVDFRASVVVGLRVAAEYLSEQTGRVILPQALQESRDRIARSFRGGLVAMRAQSFRQLLRERGVDDEELVAESTRRFFEARDGALQPFEDVVDGLTLLRERGFTLVAATNGNAALHQTPVAALLHDTWTAEEAGVSKPHPRFFESVLARAGVPASRAMMVGDRLDNDIEPAAAIGIPAVLIDRTAAIDGVPHPASAVVRSLRELPGLLQYPAEG